MAGIAVRRIRGGEWAELRDLRLRALADAPDAFATTHAEAEALPDSHWRQAVPVRATSTTQSTFVAVDGRRFVGLVGGYEPDHDLGCVHLVQMWTAPETRRRGVGRMLVGAVIEFAAARPVRLAVVRGNDRARLLYEDMGFVPDERPPLPGDPCPDELHYIRPAGR